MIRRGCRLGEPVLGRQERQDDGRPDPAGHGAHPRAGDDAVQERLLDRRHRTTGQLPGHREPGEHGVRRALGRPGRRAGRGEPVDGGRAVDRAQHRAHHGDAEGAADLAHRVVDR
ncbi:hypothetical protein IN07_13870 [Modestobacter caceresii]|uniref:Uncharacterized protein n=1 Tax=Modestobacter caceresii TaxID=1522368 RepID=A0A098Y8H7_9ACTN|nr:hypothetical protein IN07_13870 [Modestobacter caceresii]